MLTRPRKSSASENRDAAKKALAALENFREQRPPLSNEQFEAGRKAEGQEFAELGLARELVAQCLETGNKAQDDKPTIEEAA